MLFFPWLAYQKPISLVCLFSPSDDSDLRRKYLFRISWRAGGSRIRCVLSTLEQKMLTVDGSYSASSLRAAMIRVCVLVC